MEQEQISVEIYVNDSRVDMVMLVVVEEVEDSNYEMMNVEVTFL